MEFVIGIVSSIVSTTVEYTISPIQNQMKYLTGHENNVQNLKTQVERLNDARGRVQHDVNAAKRNGEEIENDVDKWLTNVNKKIAEEVEKVMQDEEKAKRKCFVGLCPNLWARYKHSVKAAVEAEAVADLLQQGKFDRVSHRVALQVITAAAVKGFETFESRMQVLNGILEAVKDDSISVVGVHGMGGVGKTTLVKEVARQVQEGKIFDSVVIATVTQTLDLKDIQNQIAELLGLKFEEHSMVGRALRLQKRLKEEKKILVVLDDIWATLDLEKVGIPSGDEHMGCKILLTSRELNVLSNGMNSENNFTIGVLNEEETWTLFKKMAGGDVVESRDLRPIATEVAKKCAGLPIAIATVARALRNKELYEWKNALLELQRPSSTNLEGVATDVYSAIELSYNRLESEEVKFTFLLCSLLGHNALIEDLLRYIIGKDLFHGRGILSTEEARNRVLTSVRKLKASCLLLDSYDDERFDIHDVVWDVAISIASRDRHMFVLRSSDELKEWPHNEIIKNRSAICLLNPRITGELKLPDEMVCPNLSFFSMGINGSVQVPANFFRGTERLQVLNLPRMHFQSLPESINHLTSLRTLCLDGCRLEDITIVGKLENLKILSLAGSNIEALPKEIGQLTGLSLLDLNDCFSLRFIPPDVLSSLSKLEELYMEDSFVGWEDGALGNRRRNASLDELKHLTHLTTLYAHIPDAQIIPKNLFTQALGRYRISIGAVQGSAHRISIVAVKGSALKYKYIRTLRVKLDTSMDDGVKILLKKSEDLCLAPPRGMKNVFGELLDNGEDCSDLKRLEIKDGLEVQYISRENDKFPQLQSITLQGLPQLISFCSEENRHFSSHQKEVAMSSKRLPLFNKQLVFTQLKSLIINGCGNLQQVLSPSIARNLVHLTHFEIEDCRCLREIVYTEEIEVEICFPQLNSIKLRKLRNLVNFCGGNYNIEFPALEVLELYDCPMLKGFINEPEMEETLFNKKVALPSLERLRIFHLKTVKKIFRNQLLAVGSFCKLKEMKVEWCDKLLTIFPANLIGVLQSLEELRVNDCRSLELIFESLNRDPQGIEPIEFEFGKVSSLALRNLRELKCFYPGQHTIVWPMLKELEISDYPTLLKILGIQEENGNYVPPRSGAGQPLFLAEKVITMLNHLRLTKCSDDISKICHRHFLQSFFNREISLQISYCDFKDLASIEGDDVLTLTPSPVKKLTLSGCKFIKHIWKKDSELGHIVPALGIFEVNNCDDLINFGPSSASFQNLNTLKVRGCRKMINLVTPSVVQNLVQLTTMRITSCYEMIEIVVNEGDEVTDEITFRMLKCLELDYLDSLESFCPGKYTINFPSLQELIVRGCHRLKIFSKGVLHIPQLRRVKESGQDDGKGRWAGDLNTTIQQIYTEKVGYHLQLSDRFPESKWNGGNPRQDLDFKSLNRLEVCNCKNLKLNYILTLAMAMCLNQLQQLVVKECSTLEEIIVEQQSDEEESAIQNNFLIIFPRLIRIRIESCSNLISVYLGSRALQFPSLESISIAHCPKMSTLSRDDKETQISGDARQNFTPFFSDKAVCPKLWKLELSYVNIQMMWDHRQLPSSSLLDLETLTVKGCHNLKYMFPSFMLKHFVNLCRLDISDCKIMEEVIFMEGLREDERMRPMLFPRLRFLKLKDLPKLSRFCYENYIEFPCLTFLTLENCSLLKTFLYKETENAQKNKVELSAFFNEKVALPHLVNLTIESMPNCRKIWADQIIEYSFLKLAAITVKSCEKLLNIFPLNMMERLEELSRLEIVDCDSLEDIVEPQAIISNQSREVASTQSIVKQTVTKSVFPRVTNLRFEKLPKLKSFYSNIHATEWPSLKKMEVTQCHNVQIFTSGYPGLLGETRVVSQAEISNRQTLFWVNEVTFPVLEALTVTHGQVLSTECFKKLKVLELICVPEKSTALPHRFFLSLPNLEIKLVVKDASLCQIFQLEGLSNDERYASALTRLSALRLSKLPELTHLWKEEFQPKEAFCGLKILEGQDCGKLKTLAPYLVCFNNLTTLKVSGCQGLINLISCSAAKSLTQLEKMSIIDCEKIKEIVACDTDEILEGAIVFSLLSYLELSRLPSLASFCVGDHSFEFPILQDLIVEECTKMKIFSPGDLSTPTLRRVLLTRYDNEFRRYVTEDKLRWEGNLKTTIRRLFEEMNVQNSEVTEATLELPTSG